MMAFFMADVMLIPEIILFMLVRAVFVSVKDWIRRDIEHPNTERR